jgi:hypothetical protein
MNEPFLDRWRQALAATVAALDIDGSEPILDREASAISWPSSTLAEAIAMQGDATGPRFPARPAVMELGCGVGQAFLDFRSL